MSYSTSMEVNVGTVTELQEGSGNTATQTCARIWTHTLNNKLRGWDLTVHA